MSTYRLSGFSLNLIETSNPDDLPGIPGYETTHMDFVHLDIAFSDEGGLLRYQKLEGENNGYVTRISSQHSVGVTINGLPDTPSYSLQSPLGLVVGATEINLSIHISTYETDSGSHDVFVFQAQDDPILGTKVILFPLDPTTFPFPSTIAEAEAFFNSINDSSYITTGPWVPDTDIDLSALPNIQILEEDRFIGTDIHDTYNRGAGADVLNGGRGNDDLDGGAGADRVLGGSGSDTLRGDSGNDRLVGGFGQDHLDGGADNDTLLGMGGNDILQGSTGRDVLRGGNDQDLLFGGNGDDRLFGALGRDTLHGDSGNDLLRGNGGRDTLYGGAGQDEIFGGTQSDMLQGGAGNDTLNGGGGFDTLEGGAGDDLLTGGFNKDTFVFTIGHGNDTIADFDATNEILDFSAFNDAGLAVGPFTQVGDDVLIETIAGSSVLLLNVDVFVLEDNLF